MPIGLLFSNVGELYLCHKALFKKVYKIIKKMVCQTVDNDHTVFLRLRRKSIVIIGLSQNLLFFVTDPYD